jgi:hypothetical protein
MMGRPWLCVKNLTVPVVLLLMAHAIRRVNSRCDSPRRSPAFHHDVAGDNFDCGVKNFGLYHAGAPVFSGNCATVLANSKS